MPAVGLRTTKSDNMKNKRCVISWESQLKTTTKVLPRTEKQNVPLKKKKKEIWGQGRYEHD